MLDASFKLLALIFRKDVEKQKAISLPKFFHLLRLNKGLENRNDVTFYKNNN